MPLCKYLQWLPTAFRMQAKLPFVNLQLCPQPLPLAPCAHNHALLLCVLTTGMLLRQQMGLRSPAMQKTRTV